MDTIQRLQKWYKARCNGEWEHQWGIKITTLDNPGWSVSIDLNETSQAGKSFDRIATDVSENDWMVCWKDGPKFEGVGDPDKLEVILKQFLEFVGA